MAKYSRPICTFQRNLHPTVCHSTNALQKKTNTFTQTNPQPASRHGRCTHCTTPCDSSSSSCRQNESAKKGAILLSYIIRDGSSEATHHTNAIQEPAYLFRRLPLVRTTPQKISTCSNDMITYQRTSFTDDLR